MGRTVGVVVGVAGLAAALLATWLTRWLLVVVPNDESHSSQHLQTVPQLAYAPCSTPELKPFAQETKPLAHFPLSLPGPTDSTTTHFGVITLLSYLQEIHHTAMASQPIRGLLTHLQHAPYSAMAHQVLMMTAMYIAVTALCALLRWARTCLVQVAFIQRPKTGQERVVGAVERELSELKCRLLKLEGEKADTEKAAAEKVGHLEEAMKEGFAAVRGEVAAVKGELAAWKRELAYGYFADRKVHEVRPVRGDVKQNFGEVVRNALLKLQQQGHALIMQAGEWMPSCCGPPQKQKQSGASTMQAEGWRSTIFGATQRQSGPFSVRAEQCRSSVFGSPRKQKQRGAPTEQAEECRLS